MTNRNGNPLTRVATAVVFIVLAACPGRLQAGGYVYTDDFSTDKAMYDSYSHSEFLAELPDPWPVPGFLIYEFYSSSRTLTFYCGSGHDAYAWLRYRFPLDGSPRAYSSATVELSLENNWGYGWIQCGCSLEGGSPWEWPSCGELGPCTFEFAGSTPSDTVYVWLRGCDASVDDLVVTLGTDTPVEFDSWTRVKCLYGDRSE